jgi:hypothetical protein
MIDAEMIDAKGILKILCWAVPAFFSGLFTVIYAAVRLAMHSALLAAELRNAEKFVTKETCHAIRRDRDRIRAACIHDNKENQE